MSISPQFLLFLLCIHFEFIVIHSCKPGGGGGGGGSNVPTTTTSRTTTTPAPTTTTTTTEEDIPDSRNYSYEDEVEDNSFMIVSLSAGAGVVLVMATVIVTVLVKRGKTPPVPMEEKTNETPKKQESGQYMPYDNDDLYISQSEAPSDYNNASQEYDNINHSKDYYYSQGSEEAKYGNYV